jgi:hypothetical protein
MTAAKPKLPAADPLFEQSALDFEKPPLQASGQVSVQRCPVLRDTPAIRS